MTTDCRTGQRLEKSLAAVPVYVPRSTTAPESAPWQLDKLADLLAERLGRNRTAGDLTKEGFQPAERPEAINEFAETETLPPLEIQYAPLSTMEGALVGLDTCVVSSERLSTKRSVANLIMKVERDLIKWHNSGFPVPIVSINLSELLDEIPSDVVDHLLVLGRAFPNGVEVGFSDSQLSLDVAEVSRVSAELKSGGLHIALRDFGTGFSNLSYLKKMPLRTLRIDKSFVRDVATNVQDNNIISAMVNLGKNLDVDIVVEGVDTADQSKKLSSIGVKIIMGKMAGDPLSASDVSAYLQSR